MSKKDDKTKQTENLPTDITESFAIQSLLLLKEHYGLTKVTTAQVGTFMGFSTRELAIALKCGEEYVRKARVRYKKIKKCRERVAKIIGDLPETYRQICRHRLPQVALIEGQGLDHLAANPEKVVEKPAAMTLLRQVKSAAGVSPEPEEGPSVINIGEIRNMMISMTEPEKLPPPDRELIVEAEVVEDD